ncbi:MAG: OsmC family protein [Crocinitomicaceae bacterium]
MLEYKISAESTAHKKAHFSSSSANYPFAIKTDTGGVQTNPAELLLGAFTACVLKNVERFSGILRFEYASAKIVVNGIRNDKPPQISVINYELYIRSNDKKLNPELLLKNIKKHGTIYNTLAGSVEINGVIIINE